MHNVSGQISKRQKQMLSLGNVHTHDYMTNNHGEMGKKILRIHEQVHLGVQKPPDEPKIQSMSPKFNAQNISSYFFL